MNKNTSADSPRLTSRSEISDLILYEMLAGFRPFNADTPQGYLVKHLVEEPTPISQAACPKAGIGGSIEDLVARMLSKKREGPPSLERIVETLGRVAERGSDRNETREAQM